MLVKRLFSIICVLGTYGFGKNDVRGAYSELATSYNPDYSVMDYNHGVPIAVNVRGERSITRGTPKHQDLQDQNTKLLPNQVNPNKYTIVVQTLLKLLQNPRTSPMITEVLKALEKSEAGKKFIRRCLFVYQNVGGV